MQGLHSTFADSARRVPTSSSSASCGTNETISAGMYCQTRSSKRIEMFRCTSNRPALEESEGRTRTTDWQRPSTSKCPTFSDFPRKNFLRFPSVTCQCPSRRALAGCAGHWHWYTLMFLDVFDCLWLSLGVCGRCSTFFICFKHAGISMDMNSAFCSYNMVEPRLSWRKVSWAFSGLFYLFLSSGSLEESFPSKQFKYVNLTPLLRPICIPKPWFRGCFRMRNQRFLRRNQRPPVQANCFGFFWQAAGLIRSFCLQNVGRFYLLNVCKWL